MNGYKKYLMETTDIEELKKIQKKVNNMSDDPQKTDLSPTAEFLKAYSKGEDEAVLLDNQILYEIIKIVKDIMDKHLYIREISYLAKLSQNKVEFDIIYEVYENLADYYVDGMVDFIEAIIEQRYPNSFEFDRRKKEVLTPRKNIKGIIFTVKEKR